MKKILDVSINKIYIMLVILISLFMLGGYFSYAMFTVTKEKSNAISIVTGNLVYDLKVDGKEGNTLTVPANTTIEFTVTLSNPNNRIARFNFYYLGSLPDGVTAGYVVSDGFNIPMSEVGSNLEKSGTSGSSNTYKIKVTNANDSEITINLGVEVGLDYNDLTLPSNGHLFEEYKVNVSDIVLTSPGENGDIYNDGEDTFITGEDPNNYIWYSGKLWRAVSINNEEKTTKLITQWNISGISYDDNNSNFTRTHMEQWLNDTSVDGFLGNLRSIEKFIVSDSTWNITGTTDIDQFSETTVMQDTVGLLNAYEYNTIKKRTVGNNYLINGLQFWLITPFSDTELWYVEHSGVITHQNCQLEYGVRPVVNLRNDVKVVEGDGTESNPYRLEGDNDKDLNGVKLNTRYSGEYISFGTGENNLYRIVSHENGTGTKITSAEPLKENGSFKTISFGNNATFSSNNTIGTFLNGEYLNNYLTEENRNMIENNTIWYLGTVGGGENYRLAKYVDTNMSMVIDKNVTTKIGLLRMGELIQGQFSSENYSYWTLTPYNNNLLRTSNVYGSSSAYLYNEQLAIKPSFNLKENIIITSGTGTKEDPFILSV